MSPNHKLEKSSKAGDKIDRGCKKKVSSLEYPIKKLQKHKY